MSQSSGFDRFCKYCGNKVYGSHVFCSIKCKSYNQKRKTLCVCSGCSKEFLKLPYLVRSSNYCSISCYLNSTRKKVERHCIVCNRSFLVKNYLIKKGYGQFCSKQCQSKRYPAKVSLNCRQCGKNILTQPSKRLLVKYCSKQCRDSFRRDYLEFVCKQCCKKFQIPRTDFKRGRGLFCTRECFFIYKGPSSLEKKMAMTLDKAKIPYIMQVKFGRFYVDFIIENKKIAIECDGEFWHMQDKIIERDARKDRMLRKLGYKVIRFSGQVINKSPPHELIKQISYQH